MACSFVPGDCSIYYWLAVCLIQMRRNWEGYNEQWAQLEVPISSLIPCTAGGSRQHTPFPRPFSSGFFGSCYWARTSSYEHLIVVYKAINAPKPSLKQVCDPGPPSQSCQSHVRDAC